MQRRDRITIEKIISEMEIGIELLGDADIKEFLADEKLKRALGMTTINVGELTKVVTGELKQQYPAFPWKQVAGMRDITAHRYQTLRMEDVYKTVHDDYPVLIYQLREIINAEG